MRIGLVFVLLFCLSSGKAQKSPLNSIKYCNPGYIEYDYTDQPLFRTYKYSNHIKFWFLANDKRNSISKFVLIKDSVGFIVYNHGLLHGYNHETRQKLVEFVDSNEAYIRYQHIFSLPHLTSGYIFDKYLDSAKSNLFANWTINNLQFSINTNFKGQDAEFFKGISLFGEYSKDSCLLSHKIKFYTQKQDSNVLSYNYTTCLLKISRSTIDSISDSLLKKYKYYEDRLLKRKDVTSEKSKYEIKNPIVLVDKRNLDIYESNPKLLLFEFWYISCLPCINAIPFINRLNNTYSSKGLEIIAVNSADESPEKVMDFMNKYGIGYLVALKGENTFFNYYNIRIFPSLIIVDTEGNLVYKHEGYSPKSENVIEEKIQSYLK